MRLQRAVVAVCVAVLFLTQVAADASASVSTSSPPSPCPTPADPLAPNPCDQTALLNAVRYKLSATLADALRVEVQLQGSLRASAFEEQQLASLLATADAKIAALDADIQRLQKEIDTTNHRIDVERAQLSALARTIYAQPDSLLLILARSQNLRDALTRSSQFVVAGMNAGGIKARLADDLKRLQTDQNKIQADRDAQAEQRAKLQGLRDDSMTLQQRGLFIGDSLKTALDRIRTELAVVGSQSPDVADAVRAQLTMDTAEIVAEASQVTSDHIRLLLKLPSEATAKGGLDWSFQGTSSVLAGGGRLTWPLLNAVLTQGFGPSTLAVEPPSGKYRHFHSGIDLAAAVNSPVLAAADGIVVVVGSDVWGYGNYIVVSHGGGLATLYGHLNGVTVAVGQTVGVGQQIGLEGSTGISTGPHLHFEVRLNGVPVDPLPYLVPGNS